MTRASGKVTGRKVTRLAQSLSHQLLQVEERTFAEIGLVFDGLQGRGERLVAAAGRRGKGWGSDAALRSDLAKLHAQALRKTVGPFEALAEETARLSRSSILAELALCEKMLPAKYKGTTDRVGDILTEDFPVDVTPTVEAFTLSAQALRPTFSGEVSRQFVLGRGDTVEQMTARLFSRDPVRLTAFSGRGLWWREVSYLNAIARHRSIDLANTTRLTAMMEWNTDAATA